MQVGHREGIWPLKLEFSVACDAKNGLQGEMGRLDDEDESSRYIYQERELVLVLIKVGLILFRIKLWLIFVGV